MMSHSNELLVTYGCWEREGGSVPQGCGPWEAHCQACLSRTTGDHYRFWFSLLAPEVLSVDKPPSSDPDPQKSKLELLIIYPVRDTSYGSIKQAREGINNMVSLEKKNQFQDRSHLNKNKLQVSFFTPGSPACPRAETSSELSYASTESWQLRVLWQ